MRFQLAKTPELMGNDTGKISFTMDNLLKLIF